MNKTQLTINASNPEGHSPAAILLLLLLGAGWSINPILLKLSLQHGLQSAEASFWMLAGPALVFLFVIAYRRQLPKISVGLLLFLCATALFAKIVPALSRATAAPYLDASFMTLIVCATPLVSALFSTALGTEQLSPKKLAALLLGAVAIVLVLLQDIIFVEGPGIFWIAIMFCVPLAYAVGQQVSVRFWPSGHSAFDIAVLQTLAATILFGSAGMLAGGGNSFELSTPSTGHLYIALWVVLSVLEGLGFYWLLKNEGPVFISMGTFVAVGIAPLWTWLIWDVPLTLSYLLSGSLLLLAGGLLARSRVAASKAQAAGALRKAHG